MSALKFCADCLSHYADSFFENFSFKTTQKSQSYMYIMVIDIGLLKYPFSTHSQLIRFFWKESKSAQLFWFDLTSVSSLTPGGGTYIFGWTGMCRSNG